VQNENTEPSLNDKPYYAEENGFNWAGYQRGNTNCIELHVTRVIYNEELRFLPDRNAVHDEINSKSEKIEKLESQKNDLETAREKYRQEVEDKNKELVELEIKADAPTEAELETPAPNAQSENNSRKRTWSNYLIWILPVLFAAYIFIFYASAIDKAFFLNEAAIQNQVKTGNYSGIQDIVNPGAIYKTLTLPPNLLVVFFPIVFLALAKLVEYLLDHVVDWWNEFRRRAYWFLGGLIMVVVTIFVFDVILANQISKKIHVARDQIDKRLGGEGLGDWPINPLNPLTYDLDMWTVVFCGFVSAYFIAGYGIVPQENGSKWV